MVELRPITPENWFGTLELKLPPEQANFVASNVFSLAESKFRPENVPLGIYEGEEMVGFAMYARNPDDGLYWIRRLMVDERHQRKGVGRAAMLRLIERIRPLPECDRIMISFVDGNSVAEALYASLGFKRTGKFEGREAIACLML